MDIAMAPMTEPHAPGLTHTGTLITVTPKSTENNFGLIYDMGIRLIDSNDSFLLYLII